MECWAHTLRAVAFDMDGLLVNTEDLYTDVGETILNRRGKKFTRQLKMAMMGLPGPQAWDVMITSEGLDDTAQRLAEEADEIFVAILPARLQILPGLEMLLDYLDQRQIPSCVATSSSHGFARQVLELVGIRQRFQFVVTAEDVLQGKPFPDIYLEAAHRLNVQPWEMLVLEDSHHGSCAGVAAGACTIAVPGDHSSDHDFSRVHYRANSLADPRIIEILGP